MPLSHRIYKKSHYTEDPYKKAYCSADYKGVTITAEHPKDTIMLKYINGVYPHLLEKWSCTIMHDIVNNIN